MTNLVILAVSLLQGNQVRLDYVAPFAGRIFVSAKCNGAAWQNGYVNSLTPAGTNSITFRRPACDAAWFKLSLQSL